VLCGSAEEITPLLPQASQARLAVDLSGACRSRPEVPWYHHAIEPRWSVLPSGLVGAPHPVAATLASILFPLAHAGLLCGAGATVLLPASALGEKAVEELYRQTLGLLNFTDWPRDQLAHQLAFNVLPFEDPARPGSASLAEDIGAEIARLLGDDAPGCDVQLLLAPTFNGFGYSLRLASPPRVSAPELSRCLAAAGLSISGTAEDPVTPVDAVRREGTLVSRIRPAGDGVCWLWAVADSLGDGAAENVVCLAEELTRSAASQGRA
jgi:aspartate-semialdehyde dehydrogenase